MTASNAETLLHYHQKVADLDGHVITQWSANSIDVRNPEEDDAATLAARNTYDKLLGEVRFLEQKLQESPPEAVTKPPSKTSDTRYRRIKELFASTPNNTLRIGSRGALVYELQKLLNAKGSAIPEDGNFQLVTFQALRDFEASKSLYPDGKLDMLTLEYLLED